MNYKYKEGDIIGPYTIIKIEQGCKKLKVQCNLCGLTSDVLAENARKSRMCKFCRTTNNTHPKENLSGKRFGRLVVRKSVVKENGRTAWLCQCDCGNTATVSTCHLKSGHTKSCGCYMIDRIKETNTSDLVGRKFGRLLVVKRVDGHEVPSGQLLTKYECLCDCGTITNVLSLNLVKGNTRSCGCISSSAGESEVSRMFREAGVKYTKQHSFRNLLSENGNVVRFDFALWNDNRSLNCLVEYNGEQHYYPAERKTNFGRQQREITDEIKRKFCESESIKLFIIRFDDNLSDVVNQIIEYYNKSKK